MESPRQELIHRPTRLLPLDELSADASVVVVLQEPAAGVLSVRCGGGADVLEPPETEVDQLGEASAVRLGGGGAVTVLAKPGPESFEAGLDEGPASAARTSVEKLG